MRRALLIISCLVFCLVSCNDGGGSGSSNPVMNTYYLDADGDGYGDPDQSTQASECPAGYVEDNTDCLDSNADINPGLGTCVLHTYYRDDDGDGYGNPETLHDPESPIEAYVCPSFQYVEDNTDCVDYRADLNPGAGTCILQTFYRDVDKDGYGNPDDPVQAYVCPSDCVEDNTDCDDDNYSINPGLGNCP